MENSLGGGREREGGRLRGVKGGREIEGREGGRLRGVEGGREGEGKGGIQDSNGLFDLKRVLI